MADKDQDQKDTSLRRKDMAPEVEASVKHAKGILADTKGLDLGKPEHARRFFRALVHAGTKDLLARGCPPGLIASFAMEAIAKEVGASDAITPLGVSENVQPTAQA